RAARSLERLGVTTMLRHTVVEVRSDGVVLEDSQGRRTELPTRTMIWAAGVRASPLAEMLAGASGGEVDRAGRLTVEGDLSLPGHPEVMALGDMVRVRDGKTGEPMTLPGLAPVAMQQGRYAARVIMQRLAEKPPPSPF